MAESTAFTGVIPVLPVADVVAAQTYYRDVLDFTIDWRQGDAFGAVSRGSITVFFERRDDPPRGITLVLNADNADALHESYAGRGAQIVEPLATRPWGMREFVVQDENGHLLRIGHVDESQADYAGFVDADGQAL